MAKGSEDEQDASGTDEEEYKSSTNRTISSRNSNHTSHTPTRSTVTAPTEYSYSDFTVDNPEQRLAPSLHAPIDIVIVMPVSSAMHGIKLTLLRDSLRFLLHSLGPRDRMGLVAFGANTGVSQVASMSTKAWPGWPKVFESMRASSQKSARGDLVEGANVAMDILMQRKSINPVSSVLIISDSSSSDNDSIDFVVSRAEAAK